MPDDLEDLARELRSLAAHLDVGEPADQRAAVRARLTDLPAAGPAAAAPETDHRVPVRSWRDRFPGLAGSGQPQQKRGVDDHRSTWGPRRRFREQALATWQSLRSAWRLDTGMMTAQAVARFLIVAVVVIVVAAVGPARAAVVDAVDGLLRIAGIELRRDPPPGGLPATPSPLPSLRTADLDEAQRVALFPVRVPSVLGPPGQVQLGDPDPAGAPRVVTLVYKGGLVRLDEFDGGVSPAFFKSAPDARWTTIGTDDGIWLPEPHPVTYVGRDGVERTGTARLAGPTLIWTNGEVTYRLEGVATIEEAQEIALSLT